MTNANKNGRDDNYKTNSDVRKCERQTIMVLTQKATNNSKKRKK